ncbi:MAG TPA: response regulator [Candidatus Saccharimonadales bacterium]|nr:response regulator [Candidatus Saccharimonadales bacterium]
MANILIIDDNQSLRTGYATFLQQSGHQAATASSVDEAIAYVATNTPDVILLDMLLPQKNGLDFLQQYDIVTAHPTVRVIAFSNLTEPQIEERAKELGVKLYLKKSAMTPTELESTINSVLGA